MIIACLNFFNEIKALKATVASYYPHVDKIVAVDGAYKGYQTEFPYSTDGSLEYLRSMPRVELVETKKFWRDQCVKRTEYFKPGKPGDVFFIVDADEVVIGAQNLKLLPERDVGWVTIQSPLYSRPYKQPRLFSFSPGLRYEGRHHWTYDDKGLVTTHQGMAAGRTSALVPITIDHRRNLHKSREALMAKSAYRAKQRHDENIQNFVKKESLNFVFLTTFDPAGVAWSLHKAIETTTIHKSTYFRHTDNYIQYPAQYTHRHQLEQRRALREADVVHAHLSSGLLRIGIKKGAKRIVHHHGTMLRKRVAVMEALDRQHADIRLCANLELTQYGEDLIYLPNPIPYAEYAKLAEGRKPGKVFRISHSPTKRQNKGTEAFLNAVAELKTEGLPIEAVLIEGKTHAEALAIKATCDAAFDSFWLGLQVSGLEAAAMGQPVIAGDEDINKRYEQWLGCVPYTTATEATLAKTIKRLIMDHQFYADEKARVGEYVLNHHDRAVVAKRYLDIVEGEKAIRRAPENMLKKTGITRPRIAAEKR